MTCPRPGSRWVAEPRAQQPALFAPCFCSLPLPSPPFLPSSMAQASPVYPRGWTRMEGVPGKQKRRAAGSCLSTEGACTALSAARRGPWAVAGLPRVPAQHWEHQRTRQMPEPGCPLRYGAGSLSTLFSMSSLTFMGIFQLLSVHPLTSDSLDLDK